MKEFIKKNSKKFYLILSMLILSFIYTQCISDNGVNYFASSGTNPFGDIPSTLPIDTESAVSSSLESESSVATKNYDQLNYTMSELTGVPVTDNEVRNAFNDVKSLMPTGNTIETFNSQAQIATIKLASSYCHRLVDNGTFRSVIWPTFNFGGNPSVVLDTDEKKLEVINTAIERFWGPGLDNGVDRDLTADQLLMLMDELIAGSANNSTTTRNAVKGICITTLASMQNIVL